MGKVVKDVDHGYKKLVASIEGLGSPIIEVGILESKADEADGKDGATLIDVATWAEFGTETEPARSFLRAFFDENQERCRTAIKILLQKVVAGTLTREQALDQFGLWAVGQIQKRIVAGIAPQNAPSTIEKKGSDKPLIDTGTMKSAISFKVTNED